MDKEMISASTRRKGDKVLAHTQLVPSSHLATLPFTLSTLTCKILYISTEMTTQSLTSAWSLDTKVPPVHDFNLPTTRSSALSSVAPGGLSQWLLNVYPTHRVGLHLISHSIKRVPTSEVRLRDEGIIPFFKACRDANDGLVEIAQRNGITLPNISPPHLDWRQEVEVDIQTLVTNLDLPLAPVIKENLDLMIQLHNDQACHWTSLVAFIGGPSDIFTDHVDSAKYATNFEGHAQAPFLKPLASESSVQAMKVMREELVKYKENAERTGWRDDEARDLVEKHLKFAKILPEVGKQ